MKYEQILEELEGIKDLENRLKFLNKMLKEVEDEELRKKIVTLMEGIISPQVQHYERSHYKMEFEPSETVEVTEPKTVESTPRREIPGRIEPVSETGLRPEGEDMTEHTTRLESSESYKTLEHIEEVSRREEAETPEQRMFESVRSRRPIQSEGAESRLFETVHSRERRSALLRETPGTVELRLDKPEINPEQLEPLRKDIGTSEYKTPDQIRDEKMRYKRKIE